MNTLGANLVKDLRYSRWWILLIWGLALTTLAFLFVPVEHRASQCRELSLLRLGTYLVVALAVGRLILLDAPRRITAYLGTRPLPLSTILASKAIVCLLMILMPAAAECLLIVLTGIQPSAVQLMYIFLDNFLTLAAFCGISAALALRVDSTGKFHVSLIAAAALYMILLFGSTAVIEKLGLRPHFGAIDWEIIRDKNLAKKIIGLIGPLSGIAWFVASRKRAALTAMLAFTLAGSMLVALFWRSKYTGLHGSALPMAPHAERPDLSKLRFVLEKNAEGKSLPSMSWQGSGQESHLMIFHFQFEGRIEGLPDGWSGSGNHFGFDTILKIPGNAPLPSKETALPIPVPEAILPSLGIQAVDPDARSRLKGGIGLFKVPRSNATVPEDPLESTLHIPLLRPVILASLPLRKGAAISAAGHRFEVITVGRQEESTGFEMIAETVDLTSSGRLNSGRPLAGIVIHRERGEYLKPAEFYQLPASSAHYCIYKLALLAPVARVDRRNPPPLPPDWEQGAEILILGAEDGGTFSPRVDFQN